MASKHPIRSTRVTLQLQTASQVVGLEETRLVFPAIVFDENDTPPQENLNTDPRGPVVVQVDVHPLDRDARRGYYGYSGVERLTLLLQSETFNFWVTKLDDIGRAPLIVTASVDDDGDIFELFLNDDPIVINLVSGTQGSKDNQPPSRIGTGTG